MEELIYESIDNKYIILKKIDKGKFGEAFLVNEKNKENIKYVAKILLKDDKHFVQKIKLIKTISNLKSPYIIYFKEASKEGKIKLKGSDNNFVTKQYAVYEYAQKKTIFEYLILPNSKLGEKYAKILFKYILKGIQAMHDADICHRDIKLENILLDEFFKPKICDFGLSFQCYNKELKSKCGTPQYWAPEICRLEGRQPYNGKRADIFSLGITLLYMVTGEQQDDVIEGFIKDKENYNYDNYLKKLKIQISNLSQDLQKLIIKMLDFNPEKRPSIKNILDDPWMKEIKEDDLNQEKELFKELY